MNTCCTLPNLVQRTLQNYSNITFAHLSLLLREHMGYFPDPITCNLGLGPVAFLLHATSPPPPTLTSNRNVAPTLQKLEVSVSHEVSNWVLVAVALSSAVVFFLISLLLS